jgi:hypothetical protein
MKISAYEIISQMKISEFEMAPGGPCAFAGGKVEFGM